MIVLDQHHVVKAGAVVGPPPSRTAHLSSTPQPRRGLSGIENYGVRALNSIDVRRVAVAMPDMR